MTDLLEKAVSAATLRSEEEQNRLAETLLAELEMLDWTRKLEADAESGKLDFLVEEARAAVRTETTRPAPSAA
jgi:hypothetical protein